MSADSDILIIGAGVLGLCTAAELAVRGHRATVVDPGGSNASAIAGGMIAPAFECLLDEADADRLRLLRDARDLWPAFAARTGVSLLLEGAEWRGPDPDRVAARLVEAGFDARREGDRVVSMDDWRVEPAAAMQAMAAIPGVNCVPGRIERIEAARDRWRAAGPDLDLTGRTLVLATGAAVPPGGLPEPAASLVAAVEPIRGQIAFIAEPLVDRTVRGRGAYVVPAPGGALIGATMEPGEREEVWNEAAGEAFIAAGLAMAGWSGPPPPFERRVGVRGSTPDGLPLAGPSGAPGLHLALAPRRNGWLLGPLVATIVADGIEGRTAGSHAAALDPRRLA